MNCVFFLDLQRLLFEIGYYFLLSQKMASICGLLKGSTSWVLAESGPCYVQHLEFDFLQTNQCHRGTAANPSPLIS